MVVSPYASLLMLEFSPQDVYKNMQVMKKIGMYSSYGFYESIDYTKEHIDTNAKNEIIKTYMAHHQGMILCSINNYINNGIIKTRFHANENIRACELLLKERERMTAKIKKRVSDKYNVFKQKNVSKYTPYVGCSYAEKKYAEQIPDFKQELKIALLKGSNLSAIITNNGASYLRYKDKILNKQRYTDIKTSGNYLYITDKTNGKRINLTDTDILSNTNKFANKCVWNSSLNEVECYIEDDELEITTTVFLSPEYSMEVKKVSMYNNSNVRREILINTYVEPAMTDYMTNVVHPSFSNLQIETYYDEQLDAIIASKRKKTEEDTDLYVYSKLLGIDLEKDVETEKMKIVNEPDKAYDADVVKYPLWPILSYRATIILDPYERQEFYYVIGISENKYKMTNALVNLDKETIENHYKITNELNSIVARYLRLVPGRADRYNDIIRDVLFNKTQVDTNKFWDSRLSQSLLWKYSISGDLPIILVYINKIENAGIISEVINFMDYVKNRKIDLDIVVLVDENPKDNGPIMKFIKTRLDRAVYMEHTKGNIYVLNVNILNQDERNVLSFLSKRYIQDVSEFLCPEDEITTDDDVNYEGIN